MGSMVGLGRLRKTNGSFWKKWIYTGHSSAEFSQISDAIGGCGGKWLIVGDLWKL